MKKLLAILLLAILTCQLVGCNTIAGVGKDIEELGEAMQGEDSQGY